MKFFFLERVHSLKNSILFFYRKLPQNFYFGLIFALSGLIIMYLTIWGGFNFIVSLGSVGTIILKKIFYILFFVIFFMLSASSGLLFYGLGIKGKETIFLLGLPLPEETIIKSKVIESMILSAWIPLVGIFMIFLAYCQVAGNNFLLAFISIFVSLPFLFVSSYLGVYITLLFVRYCNIKKVVSFIIVLILVTIVYSFYVMKPATQDDILLLLSDEMALLQSSKVWFLPYSWPGYALTYFQDGNFLKFSLHATCLWSLALFCYFSLSNLKNLFIKVLDPQSNIFAKRIKGPDYLKKFIENLKFIPFEFRVFLIKDIRVFFRTPSIWLQFIVPFGILFFYFLNIRNLSYHLFALIWKNLISFLNVFGILCILSTLSVRFIFPQWSLEGKSFWIIRLSPISLKKIYLEKFIFSLFIILGASLLLISISNSMLDIDPFMFSLIVGIISISSIAMVSFSLGLGAYFVDFSEEYYLKAVESFGGFLALVSNFAYIIFTIVLFTGLAHWYSIGKLDDFKKIAAIVFIIWLIFSIFLSYLANSIGLNKLLEKEY